MMDGLICILAGFDACAPVVNVLVTFWTKLPTVVGSAMDAGASKQLTVLVMAAMS